MLDKRRGDAIIEAASEVRASSTTTPTRRLFACASILHRMMQHQYNVVSLSVDDAFACSLFCITGVQAAGALLLMVQQSRNRM